MKRFILLISISIFCLSVFADTHVSISSPDTWTTSELQAYVGQTIVFDDPFYICNNYYYRSGSYTIAPHRIYSPTNQCLPASTEYYNMLSQDSKAQMTLSGLPGNSYHRMGERVINLTVKVNSINSLTYVSGQFVGNTRDELMKGIPDVGIDREAANDLLVCGFNLEYFLAHTFGTGYGPNSEKEHEYQKQKVGMALKMIAADIFGFVEIQQGQDALAELAQMLTDSTGHPYSFINDGGTPSGSFTKAGYVYRADKVKPSSSLDVNNTYPGNNRKLMQIFQLMGGNPDDQDDPEQFIFAINHFKAKSGTGSGKDADKGDGQGTFNGSRVTEAQSVLTHYRTMKNAYDEADILIMGDLNAYAKEDPITTLTSGGMTDLHRYFHADSSYSYVYRGAAGYLDHALANSTLLPQITGMAAYHINSDEDDSFTYDSSNDRTMFRSSDHDPVLVGLRLNRNKTATPDVTINSIDIYNGENIIIYDARQSETPAYCRLYTVNGHMIYEQEITNNAFEIMRPTAPGVYILNIYASNNILYHKKIVVL